MKLGEISKYTVLRETVIGYMLSQGDSQEEYFLHRNESGFTKLNEGDVIDAFLYVDKQKRIAATCYLPKITVSKGALVECVSVTSQGAYFNIGISKDMLFSSDDYNIDEAPKKGEFLPMKLRLRGNSIFAKLLNKEQILELNDGYKYNDGDNCIGYVYRITKDGINIVDEHYNIIFIHKNNIRGYHHLGEKISCKIIGVNEEDYYGNTIITKENKIEDDAKFIENYLMEHHYVMNYTEDSDPIVIDKIFHMSKSSFKHALGHLLKENKIEIGEKKIILKR